LFTSSNFDLDLLDILDISVYCLRKQSHNWYILENFINSV